MPTSHMTLERALMNKESARATPSLLRSSRSSARRRAARTAAWRQRARCAAEHGRGGAARRRADPIAHERSKLAAVIASRGMIRLLTLNGNENVSWDARVRVRKATMRNYGRNNKSAPPQASGRGDGASDEQRLQQAEAYAQAQRQAQAQMQARQAQGRAHKVWDSPSMRLPACRRARVGTRRKSPLSDGAPPGDTAGAPRGRCSAPWRRPVHARRGG